MSEDQEIPKVILPMIRKVMPDIIANELINTQPMTDSVGQIFRLRYGTRWQRFCSWLSDTYWRWIPGTVITLSTRGIVRSTEMREWLEANVGRRGLVWNWQTTLQGLEIKFILGKGKWATMTAMMWTR
jgi:hypothetical protein